MVIKNMNDYLTKLRKAFPFMQIDFYNNSLYKDLKINNTAYDGIYYFKSEKNWVIQYVTSHCSFEYFLDNLIEGLIKWNVY